MIILYGTKNDKTIEPIAIFSDTNRLDTYLNSLYIQGNLDEKLKSKSILANYGEHQTKTVEQIWETCEDWKQQLDLAKQCVRDPI